MAFPLLLFRFGFPSSVHPLRLHSTQLICCHCGLPSLPLMGETLAAAEGWRRRVPNVGAATGRKEGRAAACPVTNAIVSHSPPYLARTVPKSTHTVVIGLECGIHMPFCSCRQIPASKVPFSLSSPSFCSSAHPRAHPCSGSLHLYSCCSLMFDESTLKLDMWSMGWSTFAAQRRRRVRQRQFFLVSFFPPSSPDQKRLPFLPCLLSPAPND